MIVHTTHMLLHALIVHVAGALAALATANDAGCCYFLGQSSTKYTMLMWHNQRWGIQAMHSQPHALISSTEATPSIQSQGMHPQCHVQWSVRLGQDLLICIFVRPCLMTSFS